VRSLPPGYQLICLSKVWICNVEFFCSNPIYGSIVEKYLWINQMIKSILLCNLHALSAASWIGWNCMAAQPHHLHRLCLERRKRWWLVSWEICLVNAPVARNPVLIPYHQQ
jgi:hypothetical protein